MAHTKQELRQHRHWRVRTKVQGTEERPRMSVCFSGRNIHVQFVDDQKGVTLAAISTLEEDFQIKNSKKNKSNISFATKIGKIAAERAIAKQIKTVVFDRGGSRYHGKVKALADAARQTGLIF